MKKIITTLAAIAMLTSTISTVPASAYTNNDYEDIYEPNTCFVIGVNKPAQVKVKSKYTSGCKAVKISWNKASNATGYRVYKYNGKKWVKVANCRKTAYKVTGLKAGTQYKFKVKAFKRTSKGTVWGKASAVKNTVTKPNTPKFAAASATQDSIKLRWNKVKCDGYQVYQKINGSYEKIATVKGADNVTYKAESLESSTKYNFRVRAYTRDTEKNIMFSSFSDKNKTTSGLYWSPIMKAWYECMVCEATDTQIKMVEHEMTQATIDACNGKTVFEYESVVGEEVVKDVIYADEPVNFIENPELHISYGEDNSAKRNAGRLFGINNKCWAEKHLDDEKYKLTEQERYDCVEDFRERSLDFTKAAPLWIATYPNVRDNHFEGGDWEIYWDMYKTSDKEWDCFFCDNIIIE